MINSLPMATQQLATNLYGEGDMNRSAHPAITIAHGGAYASCNQLLPIVGAPIHRRLVIVSNNQQIRMPLNSNPMGSSLRWKLPSLRC